MTRRRRVLSVLRAAGLTFTDLGPSGTLVSRRRGVRVQALGRGTSVVSASGRLNARRLGTNAWLVQTRRQRRALAARRVDDQTWLVRLRDGPRRRLRRLGPESAGTHLLFDHEKLQSEIRLFQQGLSAFVCGEHVAWMLRALDVNCVLDVGALTRASSRGRCAAVGYAGRIVSFEPLAEFASADPRGSPPATRTGSWSDECALGDEDGEAEINARCPAR